MINLCFHGIGEPGRELEPGEAKYWVSTTLFKQVLDLVQDNPEVAISFDDGNASDHDQALPALTERGLDAAFFVLAGRLDQTGSLSREQVMALQDAGMSIGSHGMNHVSWRGLTEAGQSAEFVRARDLLSQVCGVPVTWAALPLGQYDRAVLRRLRANGYQRVYSSDRSAARMGAWFQPRYSIRADDTVTLLRREVLQPASALGRAQAAARQLVKRLR
ncbi:MAG: polysaccharide deacetylase family protein [Actinomycetales bacterium]